VFVDACAISLGISVASAWTPSAVLFGAFALILCATWARVGEGITVSGFDHAGRVLASVAIAHLGVEILVGSSIPAAGTVTVVCTLICLRFAVIWCLRVLRAHRAIGERVLVLGDDEEEIAEALCDHPELGMLPVRMSALEEESGIPLDLRSPKRFEALLRDQRIERVFVDCQSLTAEIWQRIGMRVELCCVVRNPDGNPSAYRIDDHVWGLPVARTWNHPDARRAWRAKRALDVTVALVGLALTAPLSIVVFIAIRSTSRGPALFRQQRLGRHGEIITVTKFRTMRHVDRPTEIDLRELANPSERQRLQHAEANSRVTGFGRWLRATSIDELPQLIDILRGDLSLTGPRPELPAQAMHYARTIDGYGARHRVVGGLSGWAQVHGLRGDTSLRERARFDNYYIDTWTLGRDLKILAATAAEVVRHAASFATRDRDL
jgi:lipopolysaccharide/colanic/teichoic acid biosynthesis glycosyltransferase